MTIPRPEGDRAPAIRERPIPFTGESVCAILDGRKTQTRRVVKFTAANGPFGGTPSEHYTSRAVIDRYEGEFGATFYGPRGGDVFVRCPHGQPGDGLWVRESALFLKPIGGDDSIGDVMYADHEDFDMCLPDKKSKMDLGWRLRPAFLMPRWASRLTLEITNIRVQRIQEISDAQMVTEGVLDEDGRPFRDPHDLSAHQARFLRAAFVGLWDSLNSKRGYGWDVNPWVWVIEFREVKP